MTTPESEYIHGTHVEERDRLSRLNQLLNDNSLQRLKLQHRERVLDVGSGLGQLSRAMGRAVGPEGHVVGIERSAEQLADAKHQAQAAKEEDLVDFRQGDAFAFPLREEEWGTFDVAHARFLLEHVPDPQAVVKSMLRAVRPGGRVVLEDDEHDILRLYPEPDGFVQLWEAYIKAFEVLGNDPYIGRKLVAHLEQAGAHPADNDLLFFGSCSGRQDFPAFVDNFEGILAGARETILRSTPIDADTFAATLAKFREWSKRPDASLWYATCWAVGRRPQ